VAAVAALVLSVDPNLTQQEVFDILINNTDKVGGYVFTNGFSNELGYGRLNAFKSVQMVFKLNGPEIVCYSPNPASEQLTIKRNNTVSSKSTIIENSLSYNESQIAHEELI
tara:strand:+ start:1260 stop:1592 length:333 start_codon:yes stop_codon:yes gene_type:complete